VVRQYGNGATLDMRTEVGLLSSNVVIRADDGPAQLSSSTPWKDRFGCRVLVANQATASLSGIAFEYCGQAGTERAALQFELFGEPVSVSLPARRAGAQEMWSDSGWEGWQGQQRLLLG